jgi:hypothetical protein
MNIKITEPAMIELLGGTCKVARMVGVAPAAVAKWKIHGIPHGKMIELAARLEVVSHRLVTRQDLFPTTWHLVWPELMPKPNLCS